MVAAVPNRLPLPAESTPRRYRRTSPRQASRPAVARPEAISSQQVQGAIAPSAGLQRLHSVQRWSLVGCLSLGLGTLGLYGFTVMQQHQWGTSYDRLEYLRRQELRLIAANAVLRNQILQQVERPQSGLIPAHSSDLVFLKPAAPRPPKPANLGAPGTLPSGSPVGY